MNSLDIFLGTVLEASIPHLFFIEGISVFTWLKTFFIDESRSAGQRPLTRQDIPEVAVRNKTTARALTYHPDLIQKLQNEHRVVLEIFGQIANRAAAKDWGAVSLLLDQFRSGLTDHLLDEAVRLYVYLQKTVDDDDSKTLIRSFRSEMDGIGRTVIKVLDRFKDVAKSSALQELFENEWRGIGVVLGDRIAREEKTLYPLYHS